MEKAQSLQIPKVEFPLDGKKFSLSHNDETDLIEFRGDAVTLVHIKKDKSTEIYTGDYRLMGDKISVRLDKKEDQKLGFPVTYTFSKAIHNNTYCLKNIQTADCWLETLVK